MATNILQLPKYEIPCSITNDEDWRDALAFNDPVSLNPIDLTGIPFALKVRQSDADTWVMFQATSADYLAAVAAGCTVLPVAFGNSYAINEALTLPGGLVVQVSQIGGTGTVGPIAAVSIKTLGNFASLPSNPAQQLSTTGQGNGAAFLLTFVPNAVGILVPASVVGTALPSGSYFYELTAAADGYTADVAYGPLTVRTGGNG